MSGSASNSAMGQSARTRMRENGLGHFFHRTLTGAFRRIRDGFTARRLHAPGFHAGACPRLLGLTGVRLGRNFHARDHLWLEAVRFYAGQSYSPQLTLGDDINLSDRVHIGCLNKITIGSGLLSGSNVLITDHAHGSYRGEIQSDPAVRPVERPLCSAGEVIIGENVWLGDGVAVLAGANIGDGAVIAANSVVNGVIPAATIAAGAPANRFGNGTWQAASGSASAGSLRPRSTEKCSQDLPPNRTAHLRLRRFDRASTPRLLWPPASYGGQQVADFGYSMDYWGNGKLVLEVESVTRLPVHLAQSMSCPRLSNERLA